MPAHKPQDIHAIFLDAFNRVDIEALVALYEPNAILVTRSGNAAGHDAIRAAYQRILGGGGLMELQTRTVIESRDGLALLHASWKLYRGEKVIPGLSTEVVRRQPDDAWLFVIDEPRTPEQAKW